MRVALIVPVVVVLCAMGCERREALPSAAVAAVQAGAAGTKVAKVVFIDKENACECTQKRIVEGWAALQAAVGQPPAVPVERLHADTQEAKAGVYMLAKALMVPPGIYFVDENGAVLEMLQGEVKTQQIDDVLKGKAARVPPG